MTARSRLARFAVGAALTVGLGAASATFLPGAASAASAACTSAGSVPATGQYNQNDKPPVIIPAFNFTNAVQLQAGQTLAQVFVSSCPFTAVAVNQPTYSTKGVAGDTLTLRQGGGLTGAKVQSYVFSKLDDHNWEVMDLSKAAPAGTYTLVLSNPVAKIGVWSPGGSITGDYEIVNGLQQGPTQDFVIGYYPAAAAAASSTSSSSASATAASSTSSSSSSSAAALPKTGAGPLLPIAGLLLLIGGAALVVVPKLRNGSTR